MREGVLCGVRWSREKRLGSCSGSFKSGAGGAVPPPLSPRVRSVCALGVLVRGTQTPWVVAKELTILQRCHKTRPCSSLCPGSRAHSTHCNGCPCGISLGLRGCCGIMCQLARADSRMSMEKTREQHLRICHN